MSGSRVSKWGQCTHFFQVHGRDRVDSIYCQGKMISGKNESVNDIIFNETIFTLLIHQIPYSISLSEPSWQSLNGIPSCSPHGRVNNIDIPCRGATATSRRVLDNGNVVEATGKTRAIVPKRNCHFGARGDALWISTRTTRSSCQGETQDGPAQDKGGGYQGGMKPRLSNFDASNCDDDSMKAFFAKWLLFNHQLKNVWNTIKTIGTHTPTACCIGKV